MKKESGIHVNVCQDVQNLKSVRVCVRCEQEIHTTSLVAHVV